MALEAFTGGNKRPLRNALIGWRMMLFWAMFMVSMNSIGTTTDIYRRNELRSPPYNPNILLGQRIYDSGFYFRLAWNIVSLPMLCYAYGGAKLIMHTLELFALAVVYTGLSMQAKALPLKLHQCKNVATTWQVPDGVPSLFAVLASDTSWDKIKKKCDDVVSNWFWAFFVAVILAFDIVISLLVAWVEFKQPHRRNPVTWSSTRSSPANIAIAPLIALEGVHDKFWRLAMLPSKIKSYYLQRRQQKVQACTKHESLVRKVIQSPNESLTPFPASRPGKVTGWFAWLRFLLNVDLDSKVPTVTTTSQPAVEMSALSHIDVDKCALIRAPVVSSFMAPAFFDRLPYDLIVDNLLPFLQHSDVASLLLTSRSIHHKLCPRGLEGRQQDLRILYREACGRYGFGNAATGGKESPSRCYSCNIPLCPGCSVARQLPEVAFALHTETCGPVCTRCCPKIFAKASASADKSGVCICRVDVLNTEWYRSEFEAIGANIPISTVSQSLRKRLTCQQCYSLSTASVLQQRAARNKRKCKQKWERDNHDHVCGYQCRRCKKVIRFAEGELPIVFFECSHCHKECVFSEHDTWVIEEAVAREVARKADGDV